MDHINFFTEPNLLFDQILVQNDLLGDIVSFFSQSTKHSVNGELLAVDFLDIEINFSFSIALLKNLVLEFRYLLFQLMSFALFELQLFIQQDMV